MNESQKTKGFFSFFPTPEYLALASAGVAVSEDGVRLIGLKRSLFGQDFSLSRHSKSALPEGVVKSGLINDEARLVAALRELNQGKELYVRATLPEERAYLFVATIARVPDEGLRDAVAFIIEENVPVSLAESVFDFDVLESDPKSPDMKVAVSVLPKKVVESYTAAFVAAGLTPVSFDIESQAIARAIVPLGEKGAKLIVNLDSKKTGFYVTDDSVVQFTTTLPYSANAGKSVDRLNDLKTEMRKIFAFWGSRSKGIERAVVCGSEALNHRVVESLMEECPVGYDIANPWVNVSDKEKDLPKELLEDGLAYASAIGLALHHQLK
jgi:Tfp pilus assembly PilM family ATPase